MTPVQTAPVVELSDDFKALTQRERDLLALEGVDAGILAALWEQLAADYEAEGHGNAAWCCRRHVERLGGVR